MRGLAVLFTLVWLHNKLQPMMWMPQAMDPAKRGREVFLALNLRSSLFLFFYFFLFRLFKDQQLHTYHPTKSISPSLSPTTSLLFIYNIKRFTSLNYLSFPSLPSCTPSLSLSPHSSPSCIKLKHVFWNKRTWGDGGIKQPSDAVCSGFIGGNNG